MRHIGEQELQRAAVSYAKQIHAHCRAEKAGDLGVIVVLVTPEGEVSWSSSMEHDRAVHTLAECANQAPLVIPATRMPT